MLNRLLAFMNRPRSLFLQKTNLWIETENGETVNLLSYLNDMVKRINEFEQRPVQTSFEGDHERIGHHTVSLLDHIQRIEALELVIKSYEKYKLFEKIEGQENVISIHAHDIKELGIRVERLEGSENEVLKQVLIRLEHLEEQFFKTLTRRITANWQRPRHKDGRFAKRNGAGDDAR